VARETAALTGGADSGQTEDNSQSSVPSPDDGSSGGDTPSSQTAAATNSQPDDESGTSEEGDNTGQVTTETAAPSSDLTPEDRAWLLDLAKQLWAATGLGEQELVSAIATDLRKTAPANLTQLARDKALSVVKQCKLVCFGEQEAGDTLPIIAGIVGVEAGEIA
jgi:hypothetical protein